MLEIRELSFKAGCYQIDNFNLSVNDGEYFVLLGPSGAGKTLLIETVMGLLPIKQGKILIDGVDVTRHPPEQRKVAYLPQDYGLFPHLGVRDNILFGAKLRKLSVDLQIQRLNEISKLLEIELFLERTNISSLSGGERQRVAIARALMAEPKVLFLDEPFAAIDEYLKRQLQKKLREIKSQLGITIFQVTHDHHEAFYLGDRIGILLAKKLHQVGEPEDLYHRPQTIEVAKFLLTRNIFLGRVKEIANDKNEVVVEIAKRKVRAHPSKPVFIEQEVHVGIRPEEIRIDPLPKDWKLCDEGDCNAMIGTIIHRTERFGSFSFEVGIEAFEQNIEIDVMKTRSCGTELIEGATVKICLSRKALWILPRENPN